MQLPIHSCNPSRFQHFRALGGFRDEYPTSEDVEFSWRLQLSGHDFGFAPEAVLYVRLRSSTRGRSRSAFRDAMGVTHLYRDFRDAGMPRSSMTRAVHEWLAIGRQARQRLEARGECRATWCDWAAMRAGLVTGSLRYRVLYL